MMDDGISYDGEYHGGDGLQNTSTSATTASGRRMTCLELIRWYYIVALALGAMGMSVIVVLSCEFFSYRSLDGEPWPELASPFDELAQASVGIFSYSTEPGNANNMIGGESCIDYDQFLDAGHGRMWLVAQYCAMAAPAAGFLGLLLLTMEAVYCRFWGSILWIPFLFLAATALQGCTFLVFADGTFCFDAASQNQCRLNSGGWFSLASTAAYFVVAILTTSLSPVASKRTYCFCIHITRGSQRGVQARDVESGDVAASNKELGTTSDSSTEKVQNFKEELEDDTDTLDGDFGDSVMARGSVDSILSPRDSMLEEPDLNVQSNSMDTANDVSLNRHDMVVSDAFSPKAVPSPTGRPSFLENMCCGVVSTKAEHSSKYPQEQANNY